MTQDEECARMPGTGMLGVKPAWVKVVGLTGSIGSGKSLVSGIFAELGAIVLSADVLAREVVAPGSPGLREIAAHFGHSVIASDGTLDRRALGRLVFASPAERRALESITHPKIRALYLERLRSIYASARPGSTTLVVYDVPLLFESRIEYRELDAVIVVWAPKDRCIERVIARDGMAREEAEARLAAQLPLDEKAARADHVIRNDGSPESVRPQVEQLYRALRSA